VWEDRDRPRLDGVPFKILYKEEKNGLVFPFSLLEIEKVVKESDGNKSLGPDGFNFAFIKEFWYLMKEFCFEGLPPYISFGIPLQSYLKAVGGTSCYGV